MNRKLVLTSVILLAAVLFSACGSAGPSVASWSTPAGSRLETNYSDALPSYLVLAMGPMNLDGTDNVLSTDQAKKILPLWQALRSSINTGGSGTAELGALVLQIEEELTADQVTAINAMRLTRTDMRNWAQAQGLMPAGFSAEMMATQQAAAGQTGQLGKAGVALLDSVVEYLEGLAQKS